MLVFIRIVVYLLSVSQGQLIANLILGIIDIIVTMCLAPIFMNGFFGFVLVFSIKPEKS